MIRRPDGSSPRLRQIREVRQKLLVVLQRVGRRFRLDRGALPRGRVVQQLDMVLFPVETGAHVQKRRQKAGRDLVFQPPAEWPSPGRIHVDRIHIWDEDIDRPPQWDRQPFPVPGIVWHVELLKQDLPDTGKGLQYIRVSAMHGDRRVVVIECTGEPERRDRRSEPPAQMSQPLDEMRRQPEIVCPNWRLSSRSLRAASAKAWPSVSTRLYFLRSS